MRHPPFGESKIYDGVSPLAVIWAELPDVGVLFSMEVCSLNILLTFTVTPQVVDLKREVFIIHFGGGCLPKISRMPCSETRRPGRSTRA
jgi:hypothetical protein